MRRWSNRESRKKFEVMYSVSIYIFLVDKGQ